MVIYHVRRERGGVGVDRWERVGRHMGGTDVREKFSE